MESKGKVVIYKSPEGDTRLDVKMEDETVWLSQSQLIELFRTTKQNISLHINNIYKERELDRNSTVKKYLTVRKEGKREVYKNFINLPAEI